MRLALRLAEKGRGRAHPNPLVGAVLAKGGKVLSQGAHEAFGGPHAEVNALRHMKNVPSGSTLYTTLEPCCHIGKTPPCVSLILKKKIGRVVAAMKDPNPRVAGKGLRALRRAGVKVVTGVLDKEAESLNRDFKKWIRTRTPYVTVKVAQTLDGNIETPAGRSCWISGTPSRKFAHRLRSQADAILIGVQTLLKDDPRLTVRLPRRMAEPGAKTHPMKVILDATLRTPVLAKVFSRQSPAPTLIFTTSRAPKARIQALRRKAEIVIL